MLSFPSAVQIYLCKEPTDMRRSFDSLAMMVQCVIQQDPLSGYVFVFRNKRGDKIKILYWNKNGFCLWYKRLERERFKFPDVCNDCVEITTEQLNWLLDGLDFIKLKGHSTLNYSRYF